MSKIVRRIESGTDKTDKKGPLHTNQIKLPQINLKWSLLQGVLASLPKLDFWMFPNCLTWLEIENPSCFWTKFWTTLILLIKMKQISVDDLFCQKHETFWLLELSSAVEARFASFLWAKSKSRRFRVVQPTRPTSFLWAKSKSRTRKWKSCVFLNRILDYTNFAHKNVQN